MANTSKVLVTGATGNIGSSLIPALIGSGVAVRALVRDEAKAQALRDQGVEVVIGDLDKPESLDAAFNGVDKLFLLTSGNPDAVKQASNAIAAAKRAGRPHVVRLSALVPEPADEPILGQMHKATDDELKASGLPYTMLKPTFFMQNTMMAAQTVATDGAVYMPMKDGRIGMIDMRDIVDAAVKVLTEDGHQGKTYALTGPASISCHDVAAALSKALGKEVKYVDVPISAGKETMVGMGFSQWTADTSGELFVNFSQGGGDRVTGNVERLTGHPPRSYEQFAKDFAQVFGGSN
ncbi:MAG: SDR family oxidoreductase [Anaerolineae bacterium]